MTDFADDLLKWKNIDDVKSTFDVIGFDDVTEDNDGALLVKLDKDQNVFLKIIEQDKFKHLDEFTHIIPYVLLIKKYKEFKFVKADYTISSNPRYLPFKFSKTKISIEDKKRMNAGIQANKISALNEMFEANELDIIVNNLKKTLQTSIQNLSEQELKNLSKQLQLNTNHGDMKSSAKQVLLMVASAAMFHSRLDEHLPTMKPKIDSMTDKAFRDTWPPKTLQECYESENTIADLLKSWRLILAIDYKPIFLAGRTALESNNSNKFNRVIKEIIEWSKESVKYVSGLGHDVLGRLFHVILDDAQHDGSFYTSVPAATLLAGITIRDNNDIPDDIKDMKIIDPACGTGTLLMAAGERIKDLMGDKYDSKIMIEKVLSGIDINVIALHMAATTLGLLSPTTKFKYMDIRKAPFGKTDDGKYAAGSLELYSDVGLLPYLGLVESGAPQQIDSKEAKTSQMFYQSADLVIMNPPFTRNDLRHDQLELEIKKRVKDREKIIFKDAPIKPSKTSSGPMFIILAEHLTKPTGTIALILPSAAATNPSSANLRVFLAKRFHIETIVVSHDPKRFWFSENTTIPEILVVMRREKRNSPTKIINLSINPNTVFDATILAKDIRSGNTRSDLRIIEQSRKDIENGDWYGVQFYSKYLFDKFTDMKDGKLLKTIKLNNIAALGSPRGVRKNFHISECPDKHARFVRYDHKTSEIKSIHVKPNKYLIVKPGRDKQADNDWIKAGLLHIGERIRFNITHAVAIKTDKKSIGTSWYPVISNIDDQDKWSKAMSVWLNSTVGIVCLLGIKVAHGGMSYPAFPVENLHNMHIPLFDGKDGDVKMDKLVKIYDKYHKEDLGLIRASNQIRISLDNGVCTALGIDKKMMDIMRAELAKEPICTGERHKS